MCGFGKNWPGKNRRPSRPAINRSRPPDPERRRVSCWEVEMNRRRFPLCTWPLLLSLPLMALGHWQVSDRLAVSTALPCCR
jgi:hypothetical protein